MGSSASERSVRILRTLIGVILLTNGFVDAISNPLFPPESMENPVGNITNDNLKEIVPPVTEHPVTVDHAPSTTEGPKTTPRDHSSAVTTERPPLGSTTTTERPVRGEEPHSVTPPTTDIPITTTTPKTPTDKTGEHFIVHMLTATNTPVVPDQPLSTHILVSGNLSFSLNLQNCSIFIFSPTCIN